jgi:UDP-galactopyranose mutase
MSTPAGIDTRVPSEGESFDFLIAGAGFAGLVLAERITTRLGRTCLLAERRNHLGGNAWDRIDAAGVRVHTYGPHYFRTNSPRIREYLAQFTAWHPVDYRILSHARGRFWNFPINLNTFEQFLGRPSSTQEMEEWLARCRHDGKPANSEEVIVSRVGREFYELFFEGYTLKQWKRHPRDLDASVCGRIPIRTNRDDRYLDASFQALPRDGYAAMFDRMAAACEPRLRILLNTDYREIMPRIRFRHLIYTGPLDEFFECEHGALPYRSLRFEPESFGPEELAARAAVSGKPGFWQPAMQVNYPGHEPFTRIVEIKHATGQSTPNTTIVREYPQDFGPGREPYYPIPAPDVNALAERYRGMAAEAAARAPLPEPQPAPASPRALPHPVSFVGRLATYRYYNMDQIVGMALAEFDRIQQENPYLHSSREIE